MTQERSIRTATPADAAAVAAIYAPIVRDTWISFETEPPTSEEMEQRIAAKLARYPWIVAEVRGAIAGYAHAGEFRARAAYRWSVEFTAYVAEEARCQGIGRALYERLAAICKAQGFRSAFAGVALPNEASVALHTAVGFEPIGVYKEVGYKFGRWRDVAWYRLALSDVDTPPVEPTPFVELPHK